jgi:hypothetical protein
VGPAVARCPTGLLAKRPFQIDFRSPTTSNAGNRGNEGGALCRPGQPSVSESQQEPWRERPHRARPQLPRACPEGSLTPWLPPSAAPPIHVQLPLPSAAAQSRKYVAVPGGSLPEPTEDPGHEVSTVLGRNAGAIRRNIGSAQETCLRSRSVSRCDDRREGVTCHRPSRSRCSRCARQRARLFASLRPRVRAALRALTLPARSSSIGNYVMAGSTRTRNRATWGLT